MAADQGLKVRAGTREVNCAILAKKRGPKSPARGEQGERIPDTEMTVFLSCRSANISWAYTISQYLTQYGYTAFLGHNDSEASGDIAKDKILESRHFIVILTPSALSRCQETNDPFRREIEAAIASHRNIVVVSVEGFQFGRPEIDRHLIGKLSVLRRCQFLSITSENFQESMRKLRDECLGKPTTPVANLPSDLAQRAVSQERRWAETAAAIIGPHLSAEQWFTQGYNLSDGSDEELRCYDKAIQLNPGLTVAFNNRGVLRRRRGELVEAERDFSEAIRLQSDFAAGYYNRGFLRESQGDLTGAEQDYSEAIRLQPNYFKAFSQRGNTRYRKGDLALAERDQSEAIRLQPDVGETYTHRGVIRHAMGDLTGAERDHSEAIRLAPHDATAFYNRGGVRHELEDFQGAEDDYCEAIRLRPNHAGTFFKRGNLRADRGDLPGAVQDYDEALRLNPHDPHAYHNRGVLRMFRGDSVGSEHDFRAALAESSSSQQKAWFSERQADILHRFNRK